ncbi:MAG: methyltransferase domain-containing protein [Myxococcales bacterium]|nr:methyltransferase domain-containing protein [Myxococcales bacterium]
MTTANTFTRSSQCPGGPGLALAALFIGLSACATASAPSADEQKLLDAPSPTQRANEKALAALSGAHRAAENKARDKYRHPAPTLAFFGLQDDFTVLELWPGGGWYTEILAPVLRDNGKLLVTSADPNGDPEDYQVKRAKELDALFAAHPQVYDKVGKVIIDPKTLSFGSPHSVDMVLAFRSLHNWMGANVADTVLREIYEVLKPGGTFGLVGHRGPPDTEPAGGYVSEAQAIELVKSAGFVLAEKSELNANPLDTKDHPKGVWTLPPNFALGEENRDKYAAIGESDRFTLRFVKPAP